MLPLPPRAERPFERRPQGASSLRRRLAPVACATAAIGALYVTLVEPYWIEVTRHRVEAPVAAPLKIAHLTDLHTRGFGRREAALLRLLAEESPDLIAITGDTITDRGFVAPSKGEVDRRAYSRIGEVLGRLHAPLGVWLVRGNWENWRRHPDEDSLYRSLGVILLVNEGRSARADLWLMGLDDPWDGSPDVEAALAGAPPGAARLALFHSPALFSAVSGRVDLALSGHTHGGQVRPPFVPPFWLPRNSGPFVAGWYRSGNSRMYVSRGIGTSTLRVRFLCRPELAIITMEPRH